LVDKEDKGINFEANSSKETIACLKNNRTKDFDNKIILEKINDEMTTKIKSDGELIKRSSDLSTKAHPRDVVGSQSELIIYRQCLLVGGLLIFLLVYDVLGFCSCLHLV
jgi:hypothetical protein